MLSSFSWKWNFLNGSKEQIKYIKEEFKNAAERYNGYGTIVVRFFLCFCIVFYQTEMEFFGESRGTYHFDKHSLFMIGRLTFKNKKKTIYYRGIAITDIKHAIIFMLLPIVLSVLYILIYGDYQIIFYAIIVAALYGISSFLFDRERGEEYHKLVYNFFEKEFYFNKIMHQTDNDIFNL